MAKLTTPLTVELPSESDCFDSVLKGLDDSILVIHGRIGEDPAALVGAEKFILTTIEDIEELDGEAVREMTVGRSGTRFRVLDATTEVNIATEANLRYSSFRTFGDLVTECANGFVLMGGIEGEGIPGDPGNGGEIVIPNSELHDIVNQSVSNQLWLFGDPEAEPIVDFPLGGTDLEGVAAILAFYIPGDSNLVSSPDPEDEELTVYELTLSDPTFPEISLYYWDAGTEEYVSVWTGTRTGFVAPDPEIPGAIVGANAIVLDQAGQILSFWVIDTEPEGTEIATIERDLTGPKFFE